MAPYTITVNSETQFTSVLWKDLTKFLDFELIPITTFNPKATSSVEECNRVLKTSIKIQLNPMCDTIKFQKSPIQLEINYDFPKEILNFVPKLNDFIIKDFCMSIT